MNRVGEYLLHGVSDRLSSEFVDREITSEVEERVYKGLDILWGPGFHWEHLDEAV